MFGKVKKQYIHHKQNYDGKFDNVQGKECPEFNRYAVQSILEYYKRYGCCSTHKSESEDNVANK